MFVPNPFQVNLLRADAIMANDNIWAYWKQHPLPNVCPKDYWDRTRPRAGLSKGCAVDRA